MARVVKIANFADGEIPHFFNIEAQVGPNRTNRHDDVALIQYLLRSLKDIPLGIPGQELYRNIYFKKDHSGVFGEETKDRLANFFMRLETAKTKYMPDDLSSLQPIQKTDVEKMKYSGNTLLQLNRLVFQDNPLAFAPALVKRHVQHLIEER